MADATVIQDYYLENYRKRPELIRYGHIEGDLPLLEEKISGESLSRAPYGEERVFRDLVITPGRYLLYVSRLEPENNAHLVIEAYNRLREEGLCEMPLVIVGDAPYARAYIDGLKDAAG